MDSSYVCSMKIKLKSASPILNMISMPPYRFHSRSNGNYISYMNIIRTFLIWRLPSFSEKLWQQVTTFFLLFYPAAISVLPNIHNNSHTDLFPPSLFNEFVWVYFIKSHISLKYSPVTNMNYYNSVCAVTR